MNGRELFTELQGIPSFESMIKDECCKETGDRLDVLQINIGRKCNLACKHCHVEAGPSRTEEMSKEVMEACLSVYKEQGFSTIDITGGAPEMNSSFRWLVDEVSKICSHVIVRSNLVILLEKGYEDLPEFYAAHKVELYVSLPYYRSKETDHMRGNGTFEASVRALKKLNALGYGINLDLVLNMVYNPGGAFLPPDQEAMEKEYKQRLGNDYGIVFNQLFTITNNPIGRFGEFLRKSGNLQGYMSRLYGGFNPGTLPGMMCRNQLSVAWDGALYDCDFNQAIGLRANTEKNILDMVGRPYAKRKICFYQHCYACTAGAGSSCGGTTEK